MAASTAARERRVRTVIVSVGASAALLVAGLVLAAPGGAGIRKQTINPTLYVNYTMNCTLTMVDDAGKTVTSIPPGVYQVEVTTPVDFGDVDLSGIFDMTACKGSVQFQLTGPGVSVQTDLDGGDSNYALFDSVDFQKSSTYVAQDGNQPTVARFSFTTLASGTPTVPVATYTTTKAKTTTTSATTPGKTAPRKTAPKPDPFRGSLAAVVGVTGKLTLSRKGQAVTTLTSGRYTLALDDRSKKSGFLLQQTRKPATTLTTAPFVGTRSVTVDLKPGQWFFYATATAHKSFFIAIAPA
ncbi:MAG TPA: hypothetical protein VG265_00105 [Gaiellaceae bacterium]|jgi:hypothetical protein|nr:hypothetical protein [Gaiellaceae bacterium]